MWRIFVVTAALACVSSAQPLPAGAAGVVQPKLLNKVDPAYTEDARANHIVGTVTLSAVIDSDGVPREIKVTSGLGYGLDEKAIEAASQWRFEPAKKDGKPVPTLATLTLKFRLDSITPPKISKKVEPKYSAEARKKRIEGRVALRVVIGVDGVPGDITVMSPLDPELDKNAIEAVKKWRWQPGMKNGEPVRVISTVEVNFDLGLAKDFRPAETMRENYNMGVHYLSGDNVIKDFNQARMYFTRSANEGFAPAQHALGLMFLHGEGGPEDDLGAFNWIKKAADQKYAKAQLFVGLMYSEGKGTWKDDTQALRWYRLAAEQNEPGAESQIGWAFENGRGVNENSAEAIKWYRKAAEHGVARARFRLGQFYRDGTGVEKDPVEALAWIRLAISPDVPDAQVEAAKLANTLSKEQLDRVDALVKERSAKP